MMFQEILRKSNEFADITIDQVLFEAAYPVLFTAYDSMNQSYLFICHSFNSNDIEWIATKTSYENVISMLTDAITIRDAFSACSPEKYIISYNRDNIEVSKLDIADIEDRILPTAGEYMNADEDEFCEEIEYYKSKIAIYLKDEVASPFGLVSYHEDYSYVLKFKIDELTQSVTNTINMVVSKFSGLSPFNYNKSDFFESSSKQIPFDSHFAFTQEVIYG